MALSILTKLKHRQLLYGVSTRLSQENLKDMMYLAGVEQQLQESISSGTDFFTVLEKKGLLGQHNYTHLMSLLETIGRIDLISIVRSDHQATSVIAVPPDKFPVAEQLAVMKRAQILRKKENYLHSMQKLDALHGSASIHHQVSESRIMHMLSLLHVSEAECVFKSPQCFSTLFACDTLSSVSLYWRSIPTLLDHFLEGETGEFECLAVLCRQYWNEFSTKVPKDYSPLMDTLKKVHTIEYRRDDVIGSATVEVYQSLQGVFSELLGSHDLLTVANASFDSLVVNGESCFNYRNYTLLIMKWFILLLHAIEKGHVDGKALQGDVLVFVSNYKQQIADDAPKISQILGQDATDKIIQLIPQTKKVSKACSQHCNSDMYHKGAFGLLGSMILALLVHATMLESPQTESQSLTSLLLALRKALLTDKEETTDSYMCITKKQISNIQREAQMYKSKCEQLIDTLTDGSPQSVDILGSLFQGSLKL
jgi:hypothetical protein